MVGEFLWTPINDDQVPDWVHINDSQTPEWAHINDSQTPDWTEILRPTTIDISATFGGQNFGAHAFAGGFTGVFDPNTSAWNEIDDTQIPGWEPIDAV
jgi:hypothetical protein